MQIIFKKRLTLGFNGCKLAPTLTKQRKQMAMRIEMKALSRLTQYVDLVQRLADEYEGKSLKAVWKDRPIPDDVRQSDRIKVDFTIGRRYARVFQTYHRNTSVHSFVDIENGDILKGDWKSPIRDKNGKLAVRGNIWADDLGESSINWCGPNYLR
jgi:hypothetical protein